MTAIENGRDLTNSDDKSPYDSQKNPKSNVTTQNATEYFDFTTIADQRLTILEPDEKIFASYLAPLSL